MADSHEIIYLSELRICTRQYWVIKYQCHSWIFSIHVRSRPHIWIMPYLGGNGSKLLKATGTLKKSSFITWLASGLGLPGTTTSAGNAKQILSSCHYHLISAFASLMSLHRTTPMQQNKSFITPWPFSLVRAITLHRFGLESPNLHQTCIMGYSWLVLKIGVIDFDLQYHFGHFDWEF